VALLPLVPLIHCSHHLPLPYSFIPVLKPFLPVLPIVAFFISPGFKEAEGGITSDGESLKITVEAWFESQNRKFYFQGINS